MESETDPVFPSDWRPINHALSSMKKTSNFKTVSFFFLACLGIAHGQGFVNLGFESATIVPIAGDPLGRVQFMPAFPGWIGTINGQVQTNALYNNLYLSTPGFALISSTSSIGSPIDGNFTVVLQAHSIVSSAEVSLFQTGLVPADARSLRFLGTTPAGLFQGQLTVALNGIPTSLSVLEDYGATALYGADISAFAGQTAQLRFTDAVGVQRNSDFFLDRIEFSPVGVPEPSTWALLGLGGALLWSGVRWRKK